MSTRRIVLGVDGSAGSIAATDWCIEYAPLLDAEVIAVHVLDLSPLYAVPETIATLEPSIDDVRKAYEDLLQTWAEPLRARGISHRTELLSGPPRRALDEIAVRENADLIVVGRRGSGAFTELLLGSVPHALAHHAHRPVVIIPTQAQSGESA
jgi:nucleotide-binding universal stress UspA family protein